MWLNAIEENPGAGIMKIKEKHEKVYLWLYFYDREWQKEHKPQISKKKLIREPFVNWDERDQQISEEVLAIAQQIKESKTVLERITPAAIARYMEKGTSFLSSLTQGKLPLTKQVLERITESHEEFVVRKIWWMRDIYIQEKRNLPSRWLFANQTGARYYSFSSTVQEALNASMQSIEELVLYDS